MIVELKVISGPHEGRTFKFNSHDTFLVGRGPQAHFRLPKKDTFFSRLHFMIEVNPPFCRLTDLDSTNGTRVNKQRVAQDDLRDGDIIQGGKTQIRVRIDEDDIRATRRQVAPSNPATSLSETEHTDIENPAVNCIGPYQIVREIGRGGMGVVHLARRMDNDEMIALKTIRPDVEVSERDIRLFLREAEILKSLDHPQIVRFIEVGEQHGQLYFAMEFVSALNASQLLKEEGRLSISSSVRIMCQVLEALEYAHQQRYVHRDIKPANILVTGQNDDQPTNVKLADFGLARVYQTSRMSGITMHGEIGGSIAFAPPEHLTNYRDSAPASDLYSVAATLYTLLTGKHVYDLPESVPSAVLKILQTDPVPISQRSSDIPQDLAAIIHRSLHRDPACRYPSAAAMRSALAKFR